MENSEISSIDYYNEAIERLTSQLKGKENLEKLIKVSLRSLQEAEQSLLDLAKQKDLKTVTGIWLDYLGKLVGEFRSGRDDEEYRKAIEIRVAIKTSDGTEDSVYNIIKSFTESEKVTIAEGLFLSGQISFDGNKNVDRSLWQVVEEIKPVTSTIILLHRYDENCLNTSWEIEKSNLDNLQVNVQGVISLLEVAFSNGIIAPLYVSPEGIETQYYPSTYEHSIPEWESTKNTLELSDGTNLEIQITPQTSPEILEIFDGKFYSENYEDKTPLMWEINEGCN